MKYLFLDDLRNPEDVTWMNIGANVDWEIVRSMDEAVKWVKRNGFPDVISFDHDLGIEQYRGDYSRENSGYDFAKWLVEYDMDTNSMPAGFRFTVHSKNPTGAKNIRELLHNYIRFKASQ